MAKQEITKAQEVFDKTEALIASGTTKADAFKQLADEYGQPLGSIRGFYYSWSKQLTGGTGKPRRRVTSPEDAMADARAVLERAIKKVDQEVEVAEERATEAKAEYEALRDSAESRKEAISAHLESLT